MALIPYFVISATSQHSRMSLDQNSVFERECVGFCTVDIPKKMKFCKSV